MTYGNRRDPLGCAAVLSFDDGQSFDYANRVMVSWTATNGAFGVVQFDIATAGFIEGMRIASLAAVHQRPVAIHSWGSVVSALAGLHLALVTPNCAMTEYSFMEHPLNDRLAVEPLRPEDGLVAAPRTPGLGVQFDEALLDEFPYTPSRNTMISTDETDIRLTANKRPCP